MMRIVFLTSYPDERVATILPHLGEFTIARSLNELQQSRGDVLLSHGTSVIVPQDLLGQFKFAYNVHSASPDYPGRDPHHFAIYDGAKRYGATGHVMTKLVDAGPIVDVEWFDVAPTDTPATLLAKADAAAIKVIQRLATKLRDGIAPVATGERWGDRKTTRADFIAMCKVPLDISAQEFERRLIAFNADRHRNLFTELHGKKFRIESE